MSLIPSRSSSAFARGSWAEARRIADVLRSETTGGLLLVAAALLGLICANSPLAEGYRGVRDTVLGPEALHLALPVGHWASDGLLALFFFLAGVELKREFVAGDLRDPRRAAVPVAAAAGGVAVPALLYALANRLHPEFMHGWAIPSATDIAFALAVLAVLGTSLPSALRTFLLTLAVVDDLIAIVIIAIFYTDHLAVLPLLLGALAVAAYAVVVRRFGKPLSDRIWLAWLVLLPLGVLAWALVHASGVHATIAGVALGLTLPVRGGAPGAAELGHHLEHHLRPLSAGFAVPVFAFFAAGVTVGGWEGLVAAVQHPAAVGVLIGLVVGKPLGILLTIWLTTRLTRAELADGLAWPDLVGLSVLAGIGFTVSLLLGELSFRGLPEARDAATVGVLVASAVAAGLAAAILVPRNARYSRLAAEEASDLDGDGIPDVYDDDPTG